MPSPDFTIKRNDTASRIQSTLENSGGTAVDLQNAAVVFKMGVIAGGTLTTAAAAVVDQVGDGSGVSGAKGQVHYNFGTSDTATAGLYGAEWQVTFASGAVQTFPNTDPILVAIPKDL